MSANGNEIKEARERKRMTQQELADAVGVSLRTVGNWEQGASVPRNSMGRLAEVLGLPSKWSGGTQGARARIGELARQRRRELGFGGAARFAEEIGVGYQTVSRFENATQGTDATVSAKLERGLDWAPGVIVRTLERVAAGELDPEDISMDTMNPPAPPVTSAALLSDEDLLTEVLRRMESWKGAIVAAGLNLAACEPAVTREQFGLAASSGHSEGDDGPEVEVD